MARYEIRTEGDDTLIARYSQRPAAKRRAEAIAGDYTYGVYIMDTVTDEQDHGDGFRFEPYTDDGRDMTPPYER